MMIYIILAFLILLFSLIPYQCHNNKQSRKIFLFLSFFCMAFVLGLRASSVGEDTKMYMEVFTYAQKVHWKDIILNPFGRTTYYTWYYGYNETIESFYLGLCKIVGLFSKNPQVYLIVISVIICFLFAKFIYDNSDDVTFATWIFLCDVMFMFAFNGIRQLLAIAIGIQAYRLLMNKKYLKSIIVLFIAFLFHNASIIYLLMIPIVLIPQKKERNSFFIIAIVVMLLPFTINAASGIISRFLPRYIDYFTTNFWTNSIGGSLVLWIIDIGLIFYLLFKKFPSKNSFNLSCFVSIYLSFEIMGLSITMFSREALFYRAFLILFYPEAIQAIKPKYRTYVRIFLMILLFLLYLSYANTPVREYSFCF